MHLFFMWALNSGPHVFIIISILLTELSLQPLMSLKTTSAGILGRPYHLNTERAFLPGFFAMKTLGMHVSIKKKQTFFSNGFSAFDNPKKTLNMYPRTRSFSCVAVCYPTSVWTTMAVTLSIPSPAESPSLFLACSQCVLFLTLSYEEGQGHLLTVETHARTPANVTSFLFLTNSESVILLHFHVLHHLLEMDGTP